MSTHVNAELRLTEEAAHRLFLPSVTPMETSCYREQLYFEPQPAFGELYHSYFMKHFGDCYSPSLAVHRHQALPEKESEWDDEPVFGCGINEEHILIATLMAQVPSTSDRSEKVLQAKCQALGELVERFLGVEGRVLDIHWG